ncbi:chromosome segregation protein SMC [bacterium]|nr:chromosome segregation protein SMC [bacterium]
MYLKELYIKGFKSFPKPIRLQFSKGVSAIVGPNGCGKTNIMDAIRWALGEQKTTALRSDRMAGVIFKGTQTRKPLASAEVSLMLGEAQGLLSNEPDVKEVVITRQMLQSGEGSYYINNTPCRLKDIHRMLLDTGIGISFYSLIEQSMIERILGGNVEDRRMLFEEASQIMKYKMDKHVTELKLERTKQARFQIQIKIDERSEIVKNLHKQVKRAERYNTIRAKFKDASIKVELHNFGVLMKDQTEKEKLKEERATEALIKQNEINKLEIEKADFDLKKAEKDKEVRHSSQEIQKMSNALFEKRSKGMELENIIGLNNQRINTLEENIVNNGGLIESKRKEKEDLLTEFERKQEELVNLNEELEKIEQEASEHSEFLLSCKKDVGIKSAAFKQSEFAYNECVNSKTNFANRMSVLEATREKNIELRDEIENEIKVLQGEIKTREEDYAKSEKEVTLLNSDISELDDLVESLKNEVGDLQKKIIANKFETESVKERISIIDDIENKNLQTQRGIEKLLGEAHKYGIKGRLTDLLEVDPEYTAGIDNFIENYGDALVCSDLAKAIEAIKMLVQEGGRASIIVIDQLEDEKVTSSFDEPTMKRSEEIVKINREVQQLGKLIKNLWVVDKIEDLKKIGESNCGVVSKMGEFYYKNGLLRGGKVESREIGPFRRKEEKKRLNSRLADLNEELNDLENKEETKQQELEANNRKLDEYDELKNKALNGYNRIKADYDNKNFQFKLKVNEKENVDSKLQEIENDYDQIKEKYDEYLKNESILREQRDKLEKEFNKIEIEYENNQVIEKEIDGKRLKLDIEKVRLTGEITTNEQEQERLDLECKSISESMQKAKEEIVELKETVKENKELKNLIEVEREKLVEERDNESTRLESLEAEQDQLQYEINRLTNEIAVLEGGKKQIENRINDIEKEILSLSLRKENISNRVQHDFEVNIEELEPEFLEDDEIYKLTGTISRYEQQLEEIGSVSSTVFDEYEEKKEKLEALKAQAKDLDDASDMLHNTIKKLNKEAIKNFRQTFEQTRDNFKQIFVRLFEGGETDLRLEDESDPLNSNIEILARPSGKKFLSISQLSSGEKSLTALALLFSLYMVKPSPFCLLDEVDAPLDDANIERFLKVLKGFSQNTQYVLITHNKRSMEISDYLYGVTMEEEGVSKVVSMKVSDLELDLDNAN